MKNKIEASIALIRKGEKLALLMQPEYGYHVGFSGGKDSQAVLELVKMAGVKYRAVYNVTTNDPPENVYFIRNNYPDVVFDHPDTTFLKIIEENGMPTRLTRFCCRILKERSGVGFATITGVRHSESRNRGGIKQLRKSETKSMKPKTLIRWKRRTSSASVGKTRLWSIPSSNGLKPTCGSSLKSAICRAIPATAPSSVSGVCSALSLARVSCDTTVPNTKSSTLPSCAVSASTSRHTTRTSTMRKSVTIGGRVK